MQEISNAAVCLFGIGTVFLGLVVIVILCKLMSASIQHMEKKPVQPTAVGAGSASAPLQKDMEVAVCAVLAEMVHTDISNIHVVSFRKLP